jgi:cell division inhibitor SepF
MSVKDYFSKLFEEPKTTEEEENEAAYIEHEEQPVKEEKVSMEKNDYARNDSVKNDNAYTRAVRGDSTPSSSVLELKVVRPESYAAVGQIADHLLNRCTVVLNLEATEKDTARRIVDFLNGVAYSIDGQIKPVANNTFVITPKNVSISGEQLTDTRNGKTNSGDEF